MYSWHCGLLKLLQHTQIRLSTSVSPWVRNGHKDDPYPKYPLLPSITFLPQEFHQWMSMTEDPPSSLTLTPSVVLSFSTHFNIWCLSSPWFKRSSISCSAIHFLDPYCSISYDPLTSQCPVFLNIHSSNSSHFKLSPFPWKF